MAKDRGPNVKVPPPIIALFFGMLGYFVGDYPVPLITDALRLPIAIGICLVGVLIAGVSVVQFFIAKTHIEPWQPASALMVNGIFAYSRNPVYLSFVVLTVGGGVGLNNLGLVGSVIPTVLALQWYVIKKEEAYLESVFQQEYIQYKQRVRRWI